MKGEVVIFQRKWKKKKKERGAWWAGREFVGVPRTSFFAGPGASDLLVCNSGVPQQHIYRAVSVEAVCVGNLEPSLLGS